MSEFKIPKVLPTVMPAPKDIVNNVEEDEDLYKIEQALEEKKEEKTDEVIMEDFFDTTLDDYKDFDNRAWNKGDGYRIPNYSFMEEKLEGLEPGLYLFAGESNSGKSALMMNIMKDICSHRENKLFGVYYSLDDSKNEIIPRIIAMEQQIPISVASKPKRYENMINELHEDSSQFQDWLNKRQAGLDKLMNETDLFKVEDARKIKNSTDLREHMKKVQLYIKSIDPEMNIIVAIDAINDIQLDPAEYKTKSGNDEMKETAKFVKDLSVDLDIVVFSSSHLRKLNGNRRPTVDDLKEANTLLYEASVVWLVYNDVSKNKGAAKIYWNQPNDAELGPVVEIDWGKNKKSSFKGRTYCMFYPNQSRLFECDKDTCNRYDALIYQQ